MRREVGSVQSGQQECLGLDSLTERLTPHPSETEVDGISQSCAERHWPTFWEKTVFLVVWGRIGLNRVKEVSLLQAFSEPLIHGCTLWSSEKEAVKSSVAQTPLNTKSPCFWSLSSNISPCCSLQDTMYILEYAIWGLLAGLIDPVSPNSLLIE